jgi:hypothetical protein
VTGGRSTFAPVEEATMSASISASTKAAGSAANATQLADELIQQLRTMAPEARETVLESLADKRPTFVNRIRQALAQEPAEDKATLTPAEIVAQARANAAQSATQVQWDALQWMQGAQGLSLMDFLGAPGDPSTSSAFGESEETEAMAATDGYQSQSAMSAYLSNKFTL